jgi:hypothetical protein
MYVHRVQRWLSEIPQSSGLVHPRPWARLSCWLSTGGATREWNAATESGPARVLDQG